MTQAYSDCRENDPHALPDIEVFYRTARACRADGWETGEGWYWWTCFPGCLPDGDPIGPFETEAEALADAQQGERLDECREERDEITARIDLAIEDGEDASEHEKELAAWWQSEAGADLQELEEFDEDAARQRIQEDPLSVQVRTGWHEPGDSDAKAEEFEVLLCTGGPAVRIIGELDECCQPRRAWLECQDWFQPWTQVYIKDAQEVLLRYCAEFYFGD